MGTAEGLCRKNDGKGNEAPDASLDNSVDPRIGVVECPVNGTFVGPHKEENNSNPRDLNLDRIRLQ